MVIETSKMKKSCKVHVDESEPSGGKFATNDTLKVSMLFATNETPQAKKVHKTRVDFT